MARARVAPVAGAFDLALGDYRAARFSSAATRLEEIVASDPSHAPATLLLARVHIKRGSPESALTLLARSHKAEAYLIRGLAFARLGDAGSSDSAFRSAAKLLKRPDVLEAELLYQRAAAQWIERDLTQAQRTLDKLPASLDSDLELHVNILRGAISSANEQLTAQAAALLQALRRAGNARDVTVHPYATLITQIAALAVELPSQELRDAAAEHVSSVPWTTDIADLHFHTLRALAWRHALDGDEFNAFRRLKEALAVTPTAAWRVAALADRAYLASALGERRWAAQELRDAHELATTIDWTTIAGEEKFALPILAELFASRDPAVAMGYAATFAKVGKSYSRILSSNRDRRVEALEAYSMGRVQAELGETREAKRLLAHAYQIYDQLGIRWRAARAALALARLGDAATWRKRAQDALEPYPRSWLAQGAPVRSRSLTVASPELEKLTPAQRAVFDLLVDGRSTEEIARTLERSIFTVRNHIKKIFKLFGVTSRPALMVKASAP